MNDIMEQTLYRLCDSIMYRLADVLGISYEAACVYGNLYFEALLCVVSCMTFFIPFMRRWKRTGLALLVLNTCLFIKLNRLAKKNFGTQYFMSDVLKNKDKQ